MARDPEFRRIFVRGVGFTMGIVATCIAVAFASTGEGSKQWLYPLTGAMCGLIAGALAQRGQAAWGLNVLVYGVTLDVTLFLFSDAVEWHPAGKQVPFVLVLLIAFLGKRTQALAYVAMVFVAFVASGAYQAHRLGDDFYSSMGISDAMTFVLAAAASLIVRARAERNARLLEDRVGDIETLAAQARRIARGDLSGEVAGSVAISEAVREMLEGLRGIVSRVQRSVQILARSTNEMAAMSTQQKRGAVSQASAVAETRQTIESLAESSRRIAEATRAVLANAEETLTNSEQAGDRIMALSGHTARINELLEFIKDISNKSEILALNASLEGTKAGEAGRGFSLVAAQMQLLAERTMATVKDVKALITDIGTATNATVLSMEQTTKLARSTTDAAREIALITQQQGSSTEQVVEAMNDIAAITGELSSSSEDTMRAIADLQRLAAELEDSVHRFVLGE